MFSFEKYYNTLTQIKNFMAVRRSISINYFSLFVRVCLLFLFYILIVFCFKTICFYYLHINVFNYISLLIIFLLIGFQLFIFIRYFIKQCDSFYPIKADSSINSFCSVSFLKGNNLFTSSLIFINDDLIFYSERGSIPNLLILKILSVFSNRETKNWYIFKNEKIKINIDKDRISINGKFIKYNDQAEIINEFKQFKYL